MRFLTVQEYIGADKKIEDLSAEINGNIANLIPAVNELLEKFGEYRAQTSGLRDMDEHLRIYKEKNEKLKKQGKPEVKVPMNSKHLYGAAIDLEDSNDKLKAWILKNVDVLEILGLYCEDFSATDTWVHFQCLPPKSGKRFFLP